MTLKIGTRGSKLALAQAGQAPELLGQGGVAGKIVLVANEALVAGPAPAGHSV